MVIAELGTSSIPVTSSLLGKNQHNQHYLEFSYLVVYIAVHKKIKQELKNCHQCITKANINQQETVKRNRTSDRAILSSKQRTSGFAVTTNFIKPLDGEISLINQKQKPVVSVGQ
jgi:hypothetical protein